MENVCECIYDISLEGRIDRVKVVFTAKKLGISQGSVLRIGKHWKRQMVNAGNLLEKEMDEEGRIVMNERKGEVVTIDRSEVLRGNITSVDAVVLGLDHDRVLGHVLFHLTRGDAGTVQSHVLRATSGVVMTGMGKGVGIIVTMRSVVNLVVRLFGVVIKNRTRVHVLVLRGDDVWLNDY
jgi:hypothetical protein